MSSISRRKMLKNAIAGTALASSASLTAPLQAQAPSASTQRKLNIKQSVSRWCYPKMTLDELCVYSAQIGFKGIDLLKPEEFEVPKKYGLLCTMGYVEAGTIPDALNVVANHDAIEKAMLKNVPIAAKAGVPNVI